MLKLSVVISIRNLSDANFFVQIAGMVKHGKFQQNEGAQAHFQDVCQMRKGSHIGSVLCQ